MCIINSISRRYYCKWSVGKDVILRYFSYRLWLRVEEAVFFSGIQYLRYSKVLTRVVAHGSDGWVGWQTEPVDQGVLPPDV